MCKYKPFSGCYGSNLNFKRPPDKSADSGREMSGCTVQSFLFLSAKTATHTTVRLEPFPGDST